LAGHQEGDIDALLDVATGFGDDLAHLAGHRRGQALLVVGHQLREAEQDLATLRRGRPLPHRPGSPRGADSHRDIGLRALLEPADDVVPVRRVAALDRLAAGGSAPLTGDVVAVGGGFDGDLGHGRECTARPRPRRWGSGIGWQPSTNERAPGHQAVAGAGAAAGSSMPPSIVTSGSQRKNDGSHQFHSPRSRIVAGSSMLRTIVASISTAVASPNPSCLMITRSSVTKTANTVIMIAAALVMVPDVMAMPRATASPVGRPRSRASLIRVRMNTW